MLARGTERPSHHRFHTLPRSSRNPLGESELVLHWWGGGRCLPFQPLPRQAGVQRRSHGQHALVHHELVGVQAMHGAQGLVADAQEHEGGGHGARDEGKVLRGHGALVLSHSAGAQQPVCCFWGV